MKWTDYPTRTDWQKRANGTERHGDLWSDAPGPSMKYVIPADQPPGKRKVVRVKVPTTGDAYRIVSEDPLDTNSIPR
jgi:hypothetical protein